MNLTVTASIVHHVYQDPDGKFGLRFSPAALNVDAEVTTLLQELNQVYNAKPAKGYASFVGIDELQDDTSSHSDDVIPEPRFVKLLDDWLHENTSFVDFSKEVANLLQEELTKYAFTDSGFLLLSDYEHSGDRFLVVSFLPVREGVMVQPDLSVHKSAQLDITKIQLAARINLTEYQAKMGDSYYVSFIKGRAGRKVSEFFLDFLGCKERVNSKASTRHLVDTVQALVKETELEEESAHAMRREVYDYCGERWQQGEHVSMEGLESRLTEKGAPSLKAFTQDKGVELPEQFPADRASLRQLIKFQGQGGGLSVAFDQTMFGQRVSYDADTDTLTIKGTPPNLRDQLRRYLGHND
ncbi:nucleoid-associated protein YejK [Aliidiomarina halalkaliphila]|uniref:Nucleoid-associated protein YejK n=1 Tax=Aliidiomarina halalkaliphila TaxID=2593535 RepID=A0A552X3S6_9GAMM|nr:nucleoid-associated protein YejK [Aliidiomarina halalkaliphila]TRW49687.1 nucleoid-associated protein YejK [Aliidiomarina halalkaliphila]